MFSVRRRFFFDSSCPQELKARLFECEVLKLSTFKKVTIKNEKKGLVIAFTKVQPNPALLLKAYVRGAGLESIYGGSEWYWHLLLPLQMTNEQLYGSTRCVKSNRSRSVNKNIFLHREHFVSQPEQFFFIYSQSEYMAWIMVNRITNVWSSRHGNARVT